MNEMQQHKWPLIGQMCHTKHIRDAQDPYANSFRPRWQKSEEWASKQLRGLGAPCTCRSVLMTLCCMKLSTE